MTLEKLVVDEKMYTSEIVTRLCCSPAVSRLIFVGCATDVAAHRSCEAMRTIRTKIQHPTSLQFTPVG